MTSEPNKLPPYKDCPDVATSVNTEAATSDIGLVMDVTKTETLTTTMKCSRDKLGKLRYCVKKQLQVEMEGIVDVSPGLCDRIREDSVAQDFIPEETFTNKLPQLELVAPKKEESLKTKGSSGEKGTPPNKKKKQMEKIHEESDAKTSEVILTGGNERLSGSSLIGPSLAASLSNESSQGNADKFPAGVRIGTSLIELAKVRRSQVCLSPKPIEFEIQVAVESLPVSLSNVKCTFDKGTTARDHDSGAPSSPSADHLQEKASQVISTADESKNSSQAANSSIKQARMQTPASVNTIVTDNSADKKKYPTSVDGQGFGSFVRPASLLPLMSRRVKPTVGYCDSPHGTKSVTSGKLDFKSCQSFANDPVLGETPNEKGKEVKEGKATIEQQKVATGQQQQFEEIPDGVLEQMVTVQSSVPKLSAVPQTVAAPFENVPTLKSENCKVAHSKSSTTLKEGAQDVTGCPFISQATGDPDVDQLLEQIKQRPLASKNEQSHFDGQVRFYVNQEKLFAKMHELLPVPENLTRKETKPVENKEQLLEWQRNLMKREEAFVGQVNSSNSLATFLNTPTRPLLAVIDHQPAVVTNGNNGNHTPLLVIVILGIAFAVSLLSTLF